MEDVKRLLCDICDNVKVSIHCKDCTKLQLYCKECFELSHKSDRKKAHAQELMNLSNNISPSLICPVHQQEVLKYICSKCIANGKHKGHLNDNIKDGCDNLVLKYKQYFKA